MSGVADRDADRDPDFEHEMRAAEYVLGTLDPRERAELERATARDPAAAERLRDWERRLAPLMGAIPAIAPPPHLRSAVLRAVSDRARPDPLVMLRRRLHRWQMATGGAGLLAAGLALFVAIAPGQRSGSGGATQTAQYLAVVQSAGALPALIVRIDLQTGTALVRPVGAEAPAGRSLELWYVGAGGTKSIGLVGATPSRIALPKGASADGVIAVSVEPQGGSPSGQATGPVVYTGKLIPE